MITGNYQPVIWWPTLMHNWQLLPRLVWYPTWQLNYIYWYWYLITWLVPKTFSKKALITGQHWYPPVRGRVFNLFGSYPSVLGIWKKFGTKEPLGLGIGKKKLWFREPLVLAISKKSSKNHWVSWNTWRLFDCFKKLRTSVIYRETRYSIVW